MNEQKINIPGEVALMGIDDIEYTNFTYPKLSTVAIPKKEIGVQSARLLLSLITDKNRDEDTPPKKDEQIILETRLIIREST